MLTRFFSFIYCTAVVDVGQKTLFTSLWRRDETHSKIKCLIVELVWLTIGFIVAV